MQKNHLTKLYDILSSQIPAGKINYVVPDLWNAWDYDGEEMRKLPSGELLVNPYRFYASVIEKCFLPTLKDDAVYLQPYGKIHSTLHEEGYKGGDWIKKSTLYSMMIRTSSAWDHDRSFSLDSANFDGIKETGTFVKTLALLPLLKKMGIDTLYLLPITRFSLKDKKGELGSPYGVASFFDLDPDLKDSMTGNSMSVEEEFQAFIEACHLLSMKVVIDIIPRTNAIDNDLIKVHPDWFYWIFSKDYEQYRVPYVEGLPKTLPPEAKYMPQVFSSPDVLRHLSLFRFNPLIQNKALWEEIVKRNPQNFSAEIEKQFGLKIAPAFSDHINDIQPPWTDVTFFRLYLDHPQNTVQYLKDPQIPPYILFDTIKANLFPGKIPNQELWNLLSGIIPYFQTRYGIDGARLDMGHALPADLIQMIFKSAKEIDADFAFIGEELNPDKAPIAKLIGYNIIIGNGFWMEPRIWEKNLHKFAYGAKEVALPMFACAETHDSARIAGREGGRILSRMVTILNLFLPNLVPFLNSGQEVYETQPMNTGVDCSEKDRFNLPKTDLFYGKLALFDKFAFHYLNEGRWEIPDHLDGAKNIRSKWLNELTDLSCFVPLYFLEYDSSAIGLGYFQKETKKCLLVFANANYYGSINCTADLEPLRILSGNRSREGLLVYATNEMGKPYTTFGENGSIWLHLNPGEVKIIEI